MTLEHFKLPAGRIVGGDPNKFEQAMDYYTKQPKLDRNNQPLKEHRIDLAINKAEFLQQVWPYILQEVAKVHPQYGNMTPDQLMNSKFAWKIVDGDSNVCPQGSQVAYNTRDGYAGCYIIKLRTNAYLPKTFKFENGAYRQVQPEEIKTGDYVVANVNINVHTEKDGGIYWNPNAYELVGYGQAIKGTGADPMKLFGGQPSAVPAGASATPISSAPAGAQMPMPQQAPAMQAPMAQSVAQPAQAMLAPAMQAPMAQIAPMAQPAQAMPAPAYDFVANAGMPFTQPVANAAGQQQYAPQAAATTAPFATTLISDR